MKLSRFVNSHRLVSLLCVVFLLSSPWCTLAGPQNKSRIDLKIGQPSIWSLAQAHYLLARMRDADQGIASPQPSLAPNDINGYRFDVLRQVLGAEGGFNGVAGAKNQVEMQRVQKDLDRKQTSRIRLDEVHGQRQVVFTQLARVNRKLASAKVEEQDLKDMPEKERPEDYAAQLKKVQTQIKDLSGAQAALQAQQADLDGQITSLEKEATAPVTAPSFGNAFGGDSFQAGPAGPGTSSTFPNDISDVITKILATPPNAQLNASTKLDNHIQLQYEIIAKQLTLLRDEVGPDQRLVFLELPSSIYTVPGKSDDYLLQIDWNIDRYYGIDPDLPLSERKQLGEYRNSRETTSAPLTLELINSLENGPKTRFVEFANGKSVAEIDVLWQIRTLNIQISSLERQISSMETQLASLSAQGQQQYQESSRRKEQIKRHKAELETDRQKSQQKLSSAFDAYVALKQNASTRTEIEALAERMTDDYEPFIQNPALGKMKWQDVGLPTNANRFLNDFRTVDIIPRQSALNVNAANATSTGLNLAAAFQWLTGIGAKVSYQRQHQVYEQFVNQEIFASGYGKGTNQFSWTFGPVPGTKCIAPGVKTTYAVLVIPRAAQIVQLHARGTSYRKKDVPSASGVQVGDDQYFRVVVPNEQTEGFWLDALNYTPVVQGERSTVVLTGQYFSPQIGVLVNGVPLTRVVSIGSTAVSSGTGVQGAYEYLSSGEIVLSFSMGNDYVGTPIITLVTPEKTSAINYFKDLKINFRNDQLSLNEASKKEPMFLHQLQLSRVRVSHNDADGSVLQLIGDGFRSKGELSINGIDIDGTQVEMASTGQYNVKLTPEIIRKISEASGDPAYTRRDSIQWKLDYKQHTRQGYEYAPTFTYTRPLVSDYDIAEFSRDGKTGIATLVLKIFVPDQATTPQATVDSGVGTVASVSPEPGGYYRVRITLNKGVDSFTLTVPRQGEPPRVFDNVGLPDPPTIDSVVNMGTGKNEGPSNEEHDVQITGKHLKRVVQVMFNTTEGRLIRGDSDSVLIVKTPKMDGATRVLLSTDLTLKGHPITNMDDLKEPEKAKYKFIKPKESEAASGAAANPATPKQKKAAPKAAR